jgi:3-methyladenine DNA glycosylase/8-oxoguanine DNA glycosylase
MWHIPPRSPDLNPIEKFWAWLRKALLARDLSDAVAKRPVLDKAAYAARVKAVCRSQCAQAVAAACAKSLRKTCAEVIRNKGAATRG